MGDHAIDVGLEDFEAAVIERSQEVLVIVDFWAGWCGPCLRLGPVLEQWVAAGGGQWVLIKVDVDSNPELSQEFEVQGIPAVKAFRNGQVVAEFVGAQPRAFIEDWLRGLISANG